MRPQPQQTTAILWSHFLKACASLDNSAPCISIHSNQPRHLGEKKGTLLERVVPQHVHSSPITRINFGSIYSSLNYYQTPTSRFNLVSTPGSNRTHPQGINNILTA